MATQVKPRKKPSLEKGTYKTLHPMKELKPILRKIKKWLDEVPFSYEEKPTVKQCLRLDVNVDPVTVKMFLAVYKDYLGFTSVLQLDSKQATLIRQLDEKQKTALKFHIDKEIFYDPFLHYGHASESYMDEGINKITLVRHDIYLKSLTKERLIHTLHMMWKTHRKFRFLVQEHTQVSLG